MVTPLHVKIALHYHVSPEQWPDLGLAIHREYADDLVSAGLLEKLSVFERPVYRSTGGLSVWVEAICAMPFPVQKWVIPERAQASRGQTEEG